MSKRLTSNLSLIHFYMSRIMQMYKIYQTRINMHANVPFLLLELVTAWEFTMLALMMSWFSIWMDDFLALHNAVDILLSSRILCWQTLRISSLLRSGKKTQSMLHLRNKLKVLILSQVLSKRLTLNFSLIHFYKSVKM